MNQNLEKLFQIAHKPERIVLGLMSGTSLDGLDLALCKFSGSGVNTKFELLHFATYPYSDSIRLKIRDIFSKDFVKLPQVCLLNSRIGILHARMILATLDRWKVKPEEVDCIASHGQTIYHAPKRLHLKPHFTNSTLQIGDGDHIAHKTGIITLSDFRQKHIAAGGEGAPLAAYGDYFLFSSPDENRILLNMGGIANFTYLPASKNPEEVFATDTGPGNTLIDALVQHFLPPQLYDEGGMIAQSGEVNEVLLKTLKGHPFFIQSIPKTIGPELFNLQYIQQAQINSDTLMLSPKDLIATLTRFSAETIAEGIQNNVPSNQKGTVYLSGGGAHNTTLITWIKELLPQYSFHNFKELGLSPDAKEAVLFALFANEAIVGQGIKLGKGDTAIPGVTFGKFSFPN
jgi:anhydro-N-acetylmuramic acid kinase